MKEKIIAKASEMFIKLGFKSITMDDIAGEMCISKKTIYKYFCNKELLIEESTKLLHEEVHENIESIVQQNYNAIEESFKIRNKFSEMFHSIVDSSPLFQLKRHYPEIYEKVMLTEIQECSMCFEKNILKGIRDGHYREGLNVASYVKFYYMLIFSINGDTSSDKETKGLELEALEYHTRAMATTKGIIELEKHLLNPEI
jgi:hypothetical protein